MSEHAPEQEAAPESGVDFSPLLDRLDEVSSDFGSRLESLEGRLPEPAAEPEPDPWAELVGSPEPEPEPQEPAVDPRQLVQVLQQGTQQEVARAVAPLMDTINQLQASHAAADLEARYPELKDPEVASAAVARAGELAQMMGMPDLARNPVLVEQAFLASKAMQAAQSEVPADGAGLTLEGGGGAPHQKQQLSDEEIGKQILNAGGSSGGLSW